MVPDAKAVLGEVHGGRVLDLATGAGWFVTYLADGLSGYDEIIGIDSDEAKGAAFAEAMRAGRGSASRSATRPRPAIRTPRSTRSPWRTRSTTSPILRRCCARCSGSFALAGE